MSKFRVGPKILHLPSKGRLSVITDPHCNYNAFQNWIEISGLDNPKNRGLILGDILDPRPNSLGEKQSKKDGLKIYEEVMKRGNIDVLLSDHLERNLYYSHMKKNYPRDFDEVYSKRKEIIDQFGYIGNEAIEHLADKVYLFAVAKKSGLVFTHAGPDMRRGDKYDSIILGRPNTVGEKIIGKSGEVFFTNQVPYSKEDVDRFLKRQKSNVLIGGHTPVLEMLLNGGHKEKYVINFGNQLIFSSSYGAVPRKETYLDIDLSKKYNSIDDLKEGNEIKFLDYNKIR